MGVVSRCVSYLEIEHWNAIKWILRYLRGTSSKCLQFGGSITHLQGYVDLGLARDLDTRWSTIEYVFIVGGTIVSWISRLLEVNALSTAKATKEMIWLQFFMEELGHPQMVQIARLSFILLRILLYIQR